MAGPVPTFPVILTFVLGGAIFRDTNLRRKGLALLAILVGVILLCKIANRGFA